MNWYQWATAGAFATWHVALCSTLGIPFPGKRQSDQALVLATCWTTRYAQPYQFGAVVVAQVDDAHAGGLTLCPTQNFSVPLGQASPLTPVNLPIPHSIPATWLGQSTAGATG